MVYKILVGSYTRSVSTLIFDPSASPPTLTFVSATEVGHHPSWLAQHPVHKDLVFATLEQSEGKVVLLKVGEDGKTSILQDADSGGEDPAHLEVGEHDVIVGNYSGSSVLSIPFTLSEPHLLPPKNPAITFEGTGPNADRQEKSHPHQVYRVAGRDEILVPDLGADKVWRLAKTHGAWEVKGHVDFEPGHGPRHVIVIDDVLYTVGELTSNLLVHSFPPLPSPATLVATIPTLSVPPPTGTSMLSAEILHAPKSSLSPAHLYVSNRNDPSPAGDPIAIFSLTSSPPERVGELRTGLDHVRGMVFGGEDNKWLVVGGANGGGIKVFERLAGGVDFKEVAHLNDLSADKPTSFVWI